VEFCKDKYVGTVWGTDNQLTVMGHYRVQNTNNKYFHNVYVLECNVCSKDTELFPFGSITTNMGNLKDGSNPCQCYSHTVWKEYQYKILATRAADKIGVKFLGWEGVYKRGLTKCLMECPKHGQYTTSNLRDFLGKLYGCTYCKGDAAGERVRKSDEHCIQAFMDSGAFHPDTKFWRSERVDKRGWKFFWYIDCPDCGEIGEGYRMNLERGHKPCGCTTWRQKQAYINLVYDNDDVVALKFGIAVKFQDRLVKQNRKSVYDIKNFGVWEFPTSLECSQAERDCRVQLKCRVLSKLEMEDGHSETTYPLNLDAIIDIYERNGGVRITYED